MTPWRISDSSHHGWGTGAAHNIPHSEGDCELKAGLELVPEVSSELLIKESLEYVGDSDLNSQLTTFSEFFDFFCSIISAFFDKCGSDYNMTNYHANFDSPESPERGESQVLWEIQHFSFINKL